MLSAGQELFVSMIRPHWRSLHAAARRYVHDRQQAEDLVQETLMRAWRNFSATEERAYRKAWLFVILRNIVFEWQRASASRVRLKIVDNAELTELLAPEPGEPLARLPALDEQAFRELLDERIAGAFDALDPAHREILVLSVIGELNYREIAEVLDCPAGTVMSRMARARRALRERLSEFAGKQPATRRANP